jgi:hypothetical protein
MARREKRVPSRRTVSRSDAGASVVRSVLQGYADRGVFRGLNVDERSGGRIDCEFVWLLGRPMKLSYDARRRRLTFPALFPGVEPGSTIAGRLRAAIDARSTPEVPAHKRVDRRRARMTCTVAGSGLSLAIDVRGANHEYVVRRALNMINDLFLLLHETYPDYLVQRFGLSSE